MKPRLHLLKKPEKKGGEKKMTGTKKELERELEMRIMAACLRLSLDDLKARYQQVMELQDDKSRDTG